MFVKEVTVQNQVGLHARPATFFIQRANEFKSSIWTEEESYGKWRGTGLSGSLGTEKKEGFCTHFSPEKGYEGAVWAAEPVKICMKRIEP